MVVGKISTDKMYLGQMYELSFGQRFADQMSYSQMTVSQMFVGKMCLGLILYVMTVAKGL
jgi:hypothetical protein